MVERRVRVRVLVERAGVGGGMAGWEVSVSCLVWWEVGAGSRMERVVMMVLVRSVRTGFSGGFMVPGSCDLKPDSLVIGLSMGGYMVETMVIQDVELDSRGG